MSTEKSEKKDGRGGPRKGAGRPKGSGKKTKICVSINKQEWHTALKSWTGKASHLVEKLVSAYVEGRGGNRNQEAAV
jgi:hypothetical protein